MRKTVFISSTVYDFKDIRKILKEIILEAGYNVIISEEGDIIINSNINIYENCFEAIDDSDIVITLIGSRYGNLYDSENEISITRQEYRHARDKLKKRLIFIDQSVWNARKIYKKYLSEGFPFKETDIIKDVRIIDFIDEVDDNKEWVISFTNSVDLIKKVKKQLKIINPQYELYYQPFKRNPQNSDGTLNFELKFKNILGKPLLEFDIHLDFQNPVLSIEYNYSRSSENMLRGMYIHHGKLYNENKSYKWSTKIFLTNDKIVFIIKSKEFSKIHNITSKYTGHYVSDNRIILGTLA